MVYDVFIYGTTKGGLYKTSLPCVSVWWACCQAECEVHKLVCALKRLPVYHHTADAGMMSMCYLTEKVVNVKPGQRVVFCPALNSPLVSCLPGGRMRVGVLMSVLTGSERSKPLCGYSRLSVPNISLYITGSHSCHSVSVQQGGWSPTSVRPPAPSPATATHLAARLRRRPPMAPRPLPSDCPHRPHPRNLAAPPTPLLKEASQVRQANSHSLLLALNTHRESSVSIHSQSSAATIHMHIHIHISAIFS